MVTPVAEVYLTLQQQTRRRLGRLVAVYGVLVLLVILGVAVNASKVNSPAGVAVLVLLFLALVAWGMRRSFERDTYIEVNLTARTYVISESGTIGAPQPLETLAPLTVSYVSPPRSPASFHNRGSHTTGKYEIHPDGRRELGLFEFRTADQARRKLEALAGAWRVSSKAYGGEVRSDAVLNAPIHERLAGDPDISMPLRLETKWGLELQPLSPGYVFRFTRPSPTRFVPAIVQLILAMALAGVLLQQNLLRDALPPSNSPEALIVVVPVLALIVAFVLRGLVSLLRGRPAALHVTPAGVTLGRTTLPFDQIEEVDGVIDVTIRGDRKKLQIPGVWFPAEAGPILAREIKRTIAETAPYARRHS